jgi:hypothetical protein
MSIENFEHNFCESRIYYKTEIGMLNDIEEKIPEIVNMYSSFFIFFLPIIYGIPKNYALRRVIFLMMLNGFASAYYHYNLNWLGKQIDELTMIFPLYIAIIELLFRLKKDRLITPKLILLDIYFILLLTLNSFPVLDFLFPITFFIPILYISYLITLFSQKYKMSLKSLRFTFFGAFCWAVSEIFCNKYTYIGHALWHIFFPLGFIKIIHKMDKILYRVYTKKNLSKKLLNM